MVINIPFNLLGLLGAYKQNFCLTITYAIFKFLCTLGSIVYVVESGPIYLLCLDFNLLTAILAFAYARDLNVIRNRRSTTPIFMIPSQPQTIVQRAQQQQYSSPSNAWEPPPDYNSALNTNQPNINEKMSVNQYYN